MNLYKNHCDWFDANQPINTRDSRLYGFSVQISFAILPLGLCAFYDRAAGALWNTLSQAALVEIQGAILSQNVFTKF